MMLSISYPSSPMVIRKWISAAETEPDTMPTPSAAIDELRSTAAESRTTCDTSIEGVHCKVHLYWSAASLRCEMDAGRHDRCVLTKLKLEVSVGQMSH